MLSIPGAQGVGLSGQIHVRVNSFTQEIDETLRIDRLDPPILGALLAFYEHRAFANAALLDINPFDQFGVELGKEMAKALDAGDAPDFDPSTRALIARAFGDDEP